MQVDAIIEGLLTYSHIVAGYFPMGVLDPNSLLRSALEKIHSKGDNPKALVNIAAPLPLVWANPELLEMVFRDFLSNALQHVTPGVRPRVSVCHERRQARVCLCVQDRGLGLPPELRKQLFGPLHTLLAFSDTGAGLGLLRVQAAADRMNAHLGVESTPGQGSRFWIELPEEAPATI